MVWWVWFLILLAVAATTGTVLMGAFAITSSSMEKRREYVKWSIVGLVLTVLSIVGISLAPSRLFPQTKSDRWGVGGGMTAMQTAILA